MKETEWMLICYPVRSGCELSVHKMVQISMEAFSNVLWERLASTSAVGGVALELAFSLTVEGANMVTWLCFRCITLPALPWF